MEYPNTALIPAGRMWQSKNKESKMIANGYVSFDLKVKNFTKEYKTQLIQKLTEGETIKLVVFNNTKKTEDKQPDWNVAVEVLA